MNSENKTASPSSSTGIEGGKWFFLQVQSNYEDKVKDAIDEIVAKSEKKFQATSYVPKKDVISVKKGKKAVTQSRIYPGYVLINALMSDSLWLTLRKVPKVLGFVGGVRPHYLKAHEVASIFREIGESKAKPELSVLFKPGDHIKIISGSFSGFEANIESIDIVKKKVKAGILIFGRETPAEFMFSDFEVMSE